MQLVVGDQFKKLQYALHSRNTNDLLEIEGERFKETCGINQYIQAFGPIKYSCMVFDK
jgi:hypothetical protein